MLLVVPAANDFHCCFVQLPAAARCWRDNGSSLERRNVLLGKELFPEFHSGVTVLV